MKDLQAFTSAEMMLLEISARGQKIRAVMRKPMFRSMRPRGFVYRPGRATGVNIGSHQAGESVVNASYHKRRTSTALFGVRRQSAAATALSISGSLPHTRGTPTVRKRRRAPLAAALQNRHRDKRQRTEVPPAYGVRRQSAAATALSISGSLPHTRGTPTVRKRRRAPLAAALQNRHRDKRQRTEVPPAYG